MNQKTIDQLKIDELVVGSTQVIEAMYARGHKVVDHGTFDITNGKQVPIPENAKTALVIYFS